ncbi:MAG: hypothetical protein M9930_07565 [Anaerolineae bacterium]|nr:hypothetical protein [Anaerolineae bacterium]
MRQAGAAADRYARLARPCDHQPDRCRTHRQCDRAVSGSGQRASVPDRQTGTSKSAQISLPRRSIWLVPDVHGVEYDATFTADENGAFAEPGIIDCLMALAAAEMGYVVSNELPDGIILDSTMPFSLLCAFLPRHLPTANWLHALSHTQDTATDASATLLACRMQIVLKEPTTPTSTGAIATSSWNNVEVTWADEGVFLAEEWQAAQSWLAASATLAQAQGTTDHDRCAFCRRPASSTAPGTSARVSWRWRSAVCRRSQNRTQMNADKH